MAVIAAGSRVILRGRRPGDLESYLRWRGEGEWRDYDAPWEPVRAPATEEEREVFKAEFLERCRDDDTGEGPRKSATITTLDELPVGWVNRYADGRFPMACSVGINICVDACLNRGFGTEALRLWVDYLFANSSLHRIGIETWSLNPRMQRVAEKLGFTLEGRERELIEWQGRWLDRLRYGLLRSEWERTVADRAAP